MLTDLSQFSEECSAAAELLGWWWWWCGGYDWTQEMRRHRFLVGPPVAARPTAQATAVGQ